MMKILLFSILALCVNTEDIPEYKTVMEMTLNKFGPSLHFTGLEFSYLLPNSSESVATTVGYTSNSENKAVTPETLYGWGSITKEFVNSVLFTLQGEGRLALTDTLGEILPEYFNAELDSSAAPVWPQEWKDIKLYQVLNMTSGIPDFFQIIAVYVNQGKMTTWEHVVTMEWTMEQVMTLAAQFQTNQLSECHKIKFCFPAGSAYNYSNTDYMLAGLIAEKVSGLTLQQLMESIVLSHVPQDGIAYFEDAGPLTGEIAEQTAAGYCDILAPDIPSGTDASQWPYYLMGAAGGLIGNTAAMNGLIRSLFNAEVVPKELTQQFLTDYYVSTKTGKLVNDMETECTGESFCYGLGTMYKYSPAVGSLYFYGGQPLAYWSMYFYLPCYDVVLSISKNSSSLEVIPLEETLDDLLAILMKKEPETFAHHVNPKFCPSSQVQNLNLGFLNNQMVQ